MTETYLTRHCLACSTPLPEQTRGRPKRFCSRHCYLVSLDKRPATVTCQDCGVVHPPTRGTTRCGPCVEAHRTVRAEAKKVSATKPWIACETCGRMFPDCKGAGRRRFCSRECTVLGPTSSPWPRRPIASPIYPWQCQGCERCFVSHTPASSRKWCSDTCYNVAAGRMARHQAISIPECGRCGRLFISRGAWGGAFCSERCGNAERNRQRRHHKRVGFRSSGFFSTRQIAERDNWTCHLCGELVPDKEWDGDIDCATLDHLVPVMAGGVHTPDNVKLAHFMCNTLRGATPLEEMQCQVATDSTTPVAMTPALAG